MATEKKKEVKVRDLKPSKDAKGGMARQQNAQRASQNRAASLSRPSSSNSASRGLL